MKNLLNALMRKLGSLFQRRPIVVTPLAVRTGDDVIIRLAERLDSDDALALLDTLKQQFPLARLHLLCGFGGVDVQRNNCGGNSGGGDERRNPPLPVGTPAGGEPASRLAAVRPEGNVMVITEASRFGLIAVYIPPKQQGDSFE